MSAPRRAPRRQVDGVFLLDKPTGLSSNHALQTVRRLFNAEKAGHTGTLDPLATGLLPLCFGEATKFAGELLDADKRYLATARLGVTTDTADAEGVVLQRRPVSCTRQDVEDALTMFLGTIDQIPPMHSALKRDGRPLYDYARAGIEVERAPRRITIHQARLTDWTPEQFTFDVRCSKGTYIRTLAADIGEHLGCGAHLTALRRTGIGSLDVDDGHTIASLEPLTLAQRDALLKPVDALLAGVETLVVSAAEAAHLRQGRTIPGPGPEQRLRIYGPQGDFLGLCRRDGAGGLRPQRLLATGPPPIITLTA